MKKTEILKAIKENDYNSFNDYISQGGDYNLKIYGRTLITHALLQRSDKCIYLLLMYGAGHRGLKKIVEWEKKLDEMDPLFMKMVAEIEKSNEVKSFLRVQSIMGDVSALRFGNYILSYRDVISYKVRSHAFMNKLMVGIHLFEYRNKDFLMRDMKEIFQCEDILKKDFNPRQNKKYAMIVSASILEELDKEIPGLSLRISGFLKFLEVPTQNLEYQLDEMKKKEALIIGVHFSDEPSLQVNGEGDIDVDNKFYDSMKTTLSKPKEAIIKEGVSRKKRDLLLMIKNDDIKSLAEFINNKKDINQKINGRSLLGLSLMYRSSRCLDTLLLFSPDTTDLKQIKDYKKKLISMGSKYYEMFEELETTTSYCHSLVVQSIFEEASNMLLARQKLSYRNVSSIVGPEKDFKQLSVGIHIFEAMNPDFVLESLRTIFRCDYYFSNTKDPKPCKKYAFILSISKIESEQKKNLDLSRRLTSFINFREVAIEHFKELIEEIETNKELIIGARFSDDRHLVVHAEGEVDVHFDFFDSMKTVLSGNSEPVIYASNYTFNSMAQWDQQLNAWVIAFKKRHGYFPNILLASSTTYSRIDLVANARGKDQLRGSSGQTPSDDEFASMLGFKGDGYELDFCIDENLGVDTIKLVYDSDPGGGLPFLEEEKEEYFVEDIAI